MAGNMTTETRASVAAFVDAIDDAQKRADAKTIIRLMQRAAGKKLKLWGPSIIGFGSRHYVYASGREGDMPIVAFCATQGGERTLQPDQRPRCRGIAGATREIHDRQGLPVYQKLADVDQTVLAKMIDNAARGKIDTE